MNYAINAEVFVKYANFEKNNTNILPGLVGILSTSFGLPAPVDGVATIFDSYVNELGALTAMGDIKEEVPRAFLNYIIFDKNFTTLKNGFVQVTGAAKIPEVGHLGHPHERLFFAEPIEIKEEGFIYIFVSNDDGQDMDVYFDDLRITHKYGDIVAGSDFYPYGLTMEGREITRDGYRYGYQGQFAEKDGETGWNSFEARQYDARIGKWISPDPAGQYFSPYLGMGNNPINGVDPDGRWLFGLFGSTSTQRQSARAFAAETEGTINDWWSKDINVSYTSNYFDQDLNTTGVMVANQSFRENGRLEFGSLNVNRAMDNWAALHAPFASGEIDFDPLTQLSLGFAGVGVAGRVASVGEIGASLLRYPNANGVGLSITKGGRSILRLDWHQFRIGGRKVGKTVNRPHIDIPGKGVKHWPWHQLDKWNRGIK